MTASRHLQLMMIVADPAIASHVARHGVDCLFVDLEWKGKHARQAHVNSWKSQHTFADVSRIREAAAEAHVMVRLNPWDSETPGEVDEALDRGANSLMLPMFTTVEEACRFADAVAGRAETVLLFETAASLAALPRILHEARPARAHIGLNDLHLDLRMQFMFQPLTEGLLDEPCRLLRQGGVPFGIGGLARVGEGILGPELLLGEHVRLGSEWAILSRSFHRQAATLEALLESTDFGREVARLRAIYGQFATAEPERIKANQRQAADRVRDLLHVVDR